MRNDMSKVVVERPRGGHHIGLHGRNRGTKTRLRTLLPQSWELDDDDLPASTVLTAKRHPISPNRPENDAYDDKNFSDLLGPLRGYLRKQVGRPWDDVYSELSQHLDRRSLSGRHIWGHVESDVSVNTWMGRSGKIYTRRYGTHLVEDFYVHPLTGLLCYTPRRRYRNRSAKQKAKRAYDRRLKQLFDVSGPEWCIIDEDTLFEYREIEHCDSKPYYHFRVWFVHRYGIIPERVQTYSYRGEIRQKVIPAHRGRISSKQASKRDIRKAGTLLIKELT